MEPYEPDEDLERDRLLDFLELHHLTMGQYIDSCENAKEVSRDNL